jgi:hypothetical protein
LLVVVEAVLIVVLVAVEEAVLAVIKQAQHL